MVQQKGTKSIKDTSDNILESICFYLASILSLFHWRHLRKTNSYEKKTLLSLYIYTCRGTCYNA